ncbi:G-PROTEIN-RECEP-F1-2 domain-containing protein [Aphelenchoides besseyi]|nr:G-PROTEIN-RECEP-F1-2 domain-containing protein [Aphelenchoides besseyi]KAI6201552.1 G-PROTEIN-RECEP-F1-2 domain-containing protein [Aphelenchoides besseyi]
MDDKNELGYELQPTEFPPDCSTTNNTTFATVEFLHRYDMIPWPNFTNCLPNCGLCQPSNSDQTYLIFNFLIIGLLLPFISLCGLFGNAFSVYVYSRPAMRTSTNLYLCALGCSDNAVILTAVFLFFFDSIRRYSLRLTIAYNFLSPFVYPAALIAQACSVYFTLIAGIDCFTHVCLPERFRQRFNHPRTIRGLLVGVVLFSIIYNLPHCFEAVLIECWHPHFNSWSLEVCAAPFRFHETYTLVYYKYMYSIFLAVGPLIALIILNTCIILFSMVFKSSPETDSGDNVALILVVLLFISCNTIALLINVFENHLSALLQWRINYIIDISNLLVVFNSSFNFCIYYRFSKLFRRNFKYSVCGRCLTNHHNVLVKTTGDQPSAALIRTSVCETGPTCDALRFTRANSTDSLNSALRAVANKEVLI